MIGTYIAVLLLCLLFSSVATDSRESSLYICIQMSRMKLLSHIQNFFRLHANSIFNPQSRSPYGSI